MPGLLRAVAATAVVSGTATATRNAVNRRQADKNVAAYSEAQQHVYAEQAAQAPAPQPPPPPPAPAPAPAPKDDMITQLERLGDLHEKGILTDEEFAAQKTKILGI